MRLTDINNAKSAVENGAVAVVAVNMTFTGDVPCVIVDNTRKRLCLNWRQLYDYPYKKFKLIGITGTNGKNYDLFDKSILEHLERKLGLSATNQKI